MFASADFQGKQFLLCCRILFTRVLCCLIVISDIPPLSGVLCQSKYDCISKELFFLSFYLLFSLVTAVHMMAHPNYSGSTVLSFTLFVSSICSSKIWYGIPMAYFKIHSAISCFRGSHARFLVWRWRERVTTFAPQSLHVTFWNEKHFCEISGNSGNMNKRMLCVLSVISSRSYET